MIDDATVGELQRHWEEGWNRGDVDTIMEPFAEDVVFSSPFVAKLTGDPNTTTISGYEALRSYVSDSLRRAAGIRYTLDATYIGVDTVILAYTFHAPNGVSNTGADSMRVDGDGKVVEWRSHYPFAPDDVEGLISE